MNITELKKLLLKMPTDELVKMIVESYKLSKEVQALVNIKLKGDEALNVFIEAYKTKIKNEFFPSRGFGKLRVGIVKKTVSDFKSICKDESLALEIMIFSVEMGVEFIDQYGDISESMVDYMAETFDKIVALINKKNSYELFVKFKNRLEAIVSDTEDAGCWGINDSFEGSLSEIKWLENDEGDDEDTEDMSENTVPIDLIRKWMKMPEAVREKILSNVWCSNCQKSVSIKDYLYEGFEHGFLIRGKCGICDADVARVIEDE